MSSKLASVFKEKNLDLNRSAFNTKKFIVTDRAITFLNSKHTFSHEDLRQYSTALTYILYIGITLHLIIILILVLQQLENQIRLRKAKRKQERLEIYDTTFESNRNSSNSLSTQPTKNNYVTFAFVFHQEPFNVYGIRNQCLRKTVIIDMLRISYSFLYANSMNISAHTYYDPTSREFTINATDDSVQMNNIYQKHCVPMALIYSVLNMVTVINILSILISETCRFYDLKLSSTDTSNSCCVIFGVILIWISSLIIISSLMLVGVADSAAPTWKCNLSESESTTRFLVINIVWFLLVTFVVVISFFYSCSLYRELSSLDYSHHRLSVFSTNHFTMNSRPNSKFLSRHLRIVNETSKRLIIFISLIIIFITTFMPNFVLTLLKNILPSNISLKPYNMIGAILNQANPTLNSIVLLILCIISRDKNLNRDLNRSESDPEHDNSRKFKFQVLLKQIRTSNLREKMTTYNSAGCIGENEETTSQENEVRCKSLMEEQEVCLRSMVKDLTCINSRVPEIIKSQSLERPKSVANSYACAQDVEEFYSKIGSRLGRNH